ncbi:MAG: thiamine phosphate synthase [Verrucomicrobiota bacterium]
MNSPQAIINETTFYGILDTQYVADEFWETKFTSLAAGGAKIIQIRAKNKTQEETRNLLDRIIATRNALSKSKRPILILNNDLALCLQYQNIGLHIKPTNSPLTEIREKLGDDRILGMSAHSPSEVASILELDSGVLNYFSIGPIFNSATKPGASPKGLKYITWVSKLSPKLPFFCVGGINRRNARQVAETGGRRIVSVSDVLLAEDTAEAVRETINLVNFEQ